LTLRHHLYKSKSWFAAVSEHLQSSMLD
jgi:hypothetical protein